MVQEAISEINAKANEALADAVNKAVQTLSLASEVNRDLSGRTVEVSAAIAREGVQYLGDVQATLRQASEEAQAFWNRQVAVAQEFPKDPTRSPQKAVALYWEGGEKFARLVDAQWVALTRLTETVQNLLERAGKETRETATKYTEKVLDLYDLRS